MGKINTGRWKKGQSGNPNGRPKTDHKALAKTVHKFIEIAQQDDYAFLHKVYAKAKKGDIPAARLVLEYTAARPGELGWHDELKKDLVADTSADIERLSKLPDEIIQLFCEHPEQVLKIAAELELQQPSTKATIKQNGEVASIN